jgi:hypothetical protein
VVLKRRRSSIKLLETLISPILYVNKNLHEPADKFVGLVQSKPLSSFFILQNKLVSLVPSQPTNLSAGS